MLFASLLPLALLAVNAEGRRPPEAADLTPNALPVIDPTFDFPGVIENGLKENLPFTKYRIDLFAEGEIPQFCKDEAEKRNYTVSDFDVFKVSYEDCGQPWIMCRHPDADVDADEMATTFGKMPLGMREFVKHVMVVKPEGLPGACAISYDDSIVIADTHYQHYIFAHEMSHSIDSHQEVPGVTPRGQGGLSISEHWHDEYSKDSATISDYARTAWPEKYVKGFLLLSIFIWFQTHFPETSLAETGIIGLFHNVVPYGVQSLAHDPASVYHQYATYQTAYRDIITPRKKKMCTARAPDSPLVHVHTGHRIKPPANHPKYKIGVKMRPGVLNHTCVLPHHQLPKIPISH
ncbi:hypothetical protein F4818DRAFT_455336 [Hypoxylon cercidicola]|nr:hypothetical protein F4818DRAFT_455336 [Hypoxylon cercidicola]